MYFIFSLIVIAMVFYQNGRINDLESLINKKLNSFQDKKEPEYTETTEEIRKVEQTSQIPPNTNTGIRKDVSSEEVSGRILGRIGIGAVIVGIAFFLKYSFDNNWVSFSGRVIIGIIIGLIIISIGQYLRNKYLQFSDLLIGGGLAIIYLSIYASYALYNIVDPAFAFICMIAVTVLGVIISIINSTITLSAVAFIGGFITPILINAGSFGELVTLIYITILNAGILGITLYKKWTNLVIVGLSGTWIIFSLWISTSYNQDLLIPTLLFLLIQFLILTTSSIYRIIIEKLKAKPIDYFAIIITAFGFAIACYDILMPMYKHYTSLGAVIISAFYILISLIAYKENPEDRTINILLPGIAVAFLTIAVPIEFSGPWICAWWFIESIVLYILASTSSSRGYQIMGVCVYVLGLFELMYYIASYDQSLGIIIFWNGPFIMTMMAVATAYVIAFFYKKYGSINTEIQSRGINVFTIIANILTLYALTTQIEIYYSHNYEDNYSSIENWSNTTVSILWALYAAILTTIGFGKKIAGLRIMGLVLFIITAFKVVTDVWSLGEIYRIISFIVFGIIALSASFVYVKYKDRLINNK